MFTTYRSVPFRVQPDYNNFCSAKSSFFIQNLKQIFIFCCAFSQQKISLCEKYTKTLLTLCNTIV